jgi:hypothetical protein
MFDSLPIIMLITTVTYVNSLIHIYFISYDVIATWKVCLQVEEGCLLQASRFALDVTIRTKFHLTLVNMLKGDWL